LAAGVNPIVVNVNPELIGRQDWNVNKTGLTYRFAIGREAATFLRMSLNQRRRKGEEITSDSWLFPAFSRIDRYENNGHPICVWLKPGEPGLPITTGGIHRIIISSAKKAGIDVVKPGPRFRGARFFTHKIHPHTFRRWWKFQMRRGGVIDSALLEHMMGQHNLRLRHGGNYDEFDPDYIRREYSKAEPFLTVTADPVFFGIESRWKPGDPTPRQLLPGTSEQTKEKEGAEQGKPTGEDVNSLHRVVREKELASYFSRGWRYVATLPSGKIVIGNSFQ